MLSCKVFLDRESGSSQERWGLENFPDDGPETMKDLFEATQLGEQEQMGTNNFLCQYF